MHLIAFTVAADAVLSGYVCSLANNSICFAGKMEGPEALCQMLEVNTTLVSIKYARLFAHRSVSAL